MEQGRDKEGSDAKAGKECVPEAEEAGEEQQQQGGEKGERERNKEDAVDGNHKAARHAGPAASPNGEHRSGVAP